MPLGLPTAIFKAVEKGLGIWDWYNKTRYQREYRELTEIIREEEAKPIYDDRLRDKDLRDQNVIDRAKHDIEILLERFIGESDGYRNNKD